MWKRWSKNWQIHKYGTRVTLYLKDNKTLYKEMHRVICRYSRTIPNLLMVDCKSNLENRKWVFFYMDRGRAKLLATALEVDSDLWKKT